MDEHDIEWRCGCGHTNPDFSGSCVGCGQERYPEEKVIDLMEALKKSLKERADEQRPIGGALPQVTRGAPWAESTASLAPIDAVSGQPLVMTDRPAITAVQGMSPAQANDTSSKEV